MSTGPVGWSPPLLCPGWSAFHATSALWAVSPALCPPVNQHPPVDSVHLKDEAGWCPRNRRHLCPQPPLSG